MTSTQASEPVSGGAKSSHPILDWLTRREKQVLREIVDGQPNKAIASNLGIAQSTAENHRSALYRKMGAHCSADVVRIAFTQNLVTS